MTGPALVLGSTSPYRRELLARLGLAFEVDAPDVDERALPDEAPEALVRRLAEAKARAVAAKHPGALVIGSDQVAVLEGAILGKPGDHASAVQQLRAASGKTVLFQTGLCLFDGRNGSVQVDVVPFRVVFRELSDEQIENYLRRERPYNCAGSFKSEGLGISLFQRLQGDDPNALIGLPLIRLVDMLANAGVHVL
ncbi:MAG: nucleoside triphosphate pyrophosphatase [Thiohalomonadaceae bacterium]